MLGIEVKAGSSLGKDDFKHIKWFAANLAKERQFTGEDNLHFCCQRVLKERLGKRFHYINIVI